ncbi:hypothetical protein [Marinomonas sp. FW-1]|uniref:hypothetical protein n=1 Tax=Marinomonas sp. FW-1 TaxID=2071621 RepID=UPI0010C07330|nr:hypothetical protein [Marinomonas sp. FW-1]
MTRPDRQISRSLLMTRADASKNETGASGAQKSKPLLQEQGNCCSKPLQLSLLIPRNEKT